jgi:hypothetical protein
MIVGLVRMDTDAGPDIVFPLGGGNNFPPLALACRNVEKPPDAGSARPCQHPLLVLCQTGIIQVAMRIDQHHASSCVSGSSRRGNTP